jgi:hypothetical protein
MAVIINSNILIIGVDNFKICNINFSRCLIALSMKKVKAMVFVLFNSILMFDFVSLETVVL